MLLLVALFLIKFLLTINGVKQEDIPAPNLFSIYFAVLLMSAFNDCDTGIQLKFRTSGKVFNLRRFYSKTKTFVMLIRELLYADDTVFVAHSIEDMQLIMDHFSFCLHCIRAHSKSEKDENDVHTCTR